jgi:hypothetical protein
MYLYDDFESFNRSLKQWKASATKQLIRLASHPTYCRHHPCFFLRTEEYNSATNTLTEQRWCI